MSNYVVVLHKPTGSVNIPVSYATWQSYTIPAVPDDYKSASVASKFQLFSDTTYTTSKTTEYSGSNFSIYYSYYRWAIGTSGGTKVTPGDIVDLDDYSNYHLTDSTEVTYINLYPVIFRKYLRGTFGYGPYSYNEFTITGKCNYKGGTDTSVTSKVRRQSLAKNWTKIQNMEFGPISPGTTTDVDISSIDYTEGDTVYIKGVYDYRTSWAAYSNTKTVADLPKPTAPTLTTSTYDVYLKTSQGITHADETLSVSMNTTYAFDHWSTDAEGTDTVAEDAQPLTATTYYAVWKSTTTNTTVLPQWTSTSTMKYGDTAYENYTLSCYRLKSDTTPWYTHTSSKYEFKPAKHTSWKSGDTTYTIGSVVSLSAGSTYTAVWEPDTSGTSTYELSATTLPCPEPSKRSGYTYLGLASSSTSSTPDYALDSVITVTSNMTLYAVWEADGTVEIYNATTGSFEKYQAVVYNSSTGEWDLCIPKIYNGTNWDDIYM